MKILPENCAKFVMYEYMKSLICKNPKKPSSMERFFSGVGAGVVAQLTVYPLEITRTRLALARTGELNGIDSTARLIYENEGWKGLYRGCNASVLFIVPYAGTDLFVYNTLRHLYVDRTNEKPPASVKLLSGAVASICGQVVSYPLQLIRTRLQAYGRSPSEWKQEPSIMNVVKYIYLRRGLKGFYTGIGCNFMKSIPSISISYAIYERSRSCLEKLVSPSD